MSQGHSVRDSSFRAGEAAYGKADTQDRLTKGVPVPAGQLPH
jgi:hypothetical protein